MTRSRLKSTRVLLMSSVVILVSIVIVASANIYMFYKTGQNLSLINQTYNRKLDVLQSMTQVVRERSLVMLSMYLEDDVWKRDEHYMAFHALALKFIQLREQLLNTGLSEVEEMEFNRAIDIIKITEPLQNNIVEQIHSGDSSKAKNEITQKDLPKEYELLELLNKLSAHIRSNAHVSSERAWQELIHSIILVTVASVIVTLIIIAFLYYSARKVKKIEETLLSQSDSLSWVATHDALTNIYNRRWLEHVLESEVKKNDSDNITHSIIYMDLDNFKPINDMYGHSAGDEYLKSFCREVEKHIRQNDLFARVGGDEFVVLLLNCDLAHSKEIAEKIMQGVRFLTIIIDGNEVSVQCSMGLCDFDSRIGSVQSIFNKADDLCYRAKSLGKNMIAMPE